MNPRSYLIGIAGPSGAGKSYLAGLLLSALGDAVLLCLDSYYPDLSDLPFEERARSNFDDPEMLDSKLLIAHIRELAAGRRITRPLYDFATHTRSQEGEDVQPHPYILVEGLHVLYWPELRELLQTKVYLDLADDICLARRLERDIRERGRSRESIIEQYRDTVAPMAAAHVRPTARFADLNLSGTEPASIAIDRILHHVRQVTKGHLPASATHNL